MRKVQAATSNESAKCSFGSVHRELTGTAVNHVGPRGPTTRERERESGSGEVERKEAEGALLTYNIHTKRQTKTNATCKHTVPYALSCPGNSKKVQSTQISQDRVTQHSTDSNTRSLSASHWSGVSRDIVFTNTPTTQVCRLLLLTTLAGVASPVVCCISIS